MLMARRLCVHWCCVDRSAKRINKTRTTALQVKKHHENKQTAEKLHCGCGTRIAHSPGLSISGEDSQILQI
jgi:hypothetical protein